ncbi:MAG TPA: hypothetical protein VGQ04_04595 [Chitinophagaceae bacterium]|jgi:ribosomal protein L35AE/L33A|nr:hypothetical protein [Chitinophagaceae bacterium]
MIILQIEHPVPDYGSWKKAFDIDPVNRKESGVKGYRVFRQTDNPNYVIIELEFDKLDKAKELLTALQTVWKQIEGKIITRPKTRIIEMVEHMQY